MLQHLPIFCWHRRTSTGNAVLLVRSDDACVSKYYARRNDYIHEKCVRSTGTCRRVQRCAPEHPMMILDKMSNTFDLRFFLSSMTDQVRCLERFRPVLCFTQKRFTLHSTAATHPHLHGTTLSGLISGYITCTLHGITLSELLSDYITVTLHGHNFGINCVIGVSNMV